MLKPEHIMHLKLNSTDLVNRITKHNNNTSEEHTPLDYQFSLLGDIVLCKLLNIDPALFAMQLEAARELDTSYLAQDDGGRTIGISTVTSLIKDDNVLNKHLIVPRRKVKKCPQLFRQYVVGLFINGCVKDKQLMSLDAIHIAGWTDTYKLHKDGTKNPLPHKFETKMPVAVLPCTELKPITSLIEKLAAQSACV